MVIIGKVAANGVEYFYKDGVRIPRPRTMRGVKWQGKRKSASRKKKTLRKRRQPMTAVRRRRTQRSAIKLPKEIVIPNQLIPIDASLGSRKPRKITKKEALKLEINGIAFAAELPLEGIYIGNQNSYTVAQLQDKLEKLTQKYGKVPHV